MRMRSAFFLPWWWALVVLVDGQNLGPAVEETVHPLPSHTDCPPSVSATPTETAAPSPSPSLAPTLSSAPTITGEPTAVHSEMPSSSAAPTSTPTESPAPSPSPSEFPTKGPSTSPSMAPSSSPTTPKPSVSPSSIPSDVPSLAPSLIPTAMVSEVPSVTPTISPTLTRSSAPSDMPSMAPSVVPSTEPSLAPSGKPSAFPSVQTSEEPTVTPSPKPSTIPSSMPSDTPSLVPSSGPTATSSEEPTISASAVPSGVPSTDEPSGILSDIPSNAPSMEPSIAPSTLKPTSLPSDMPSVVPSLPPSLILPSVSPTRRRTYHPSLIPSKAPTVVSSEEPTTHPTTDAQTASPSLAIGNNPSGLPSFEVTPQPTVTSSSEHSSMPFTSPLSTDIESATPSSNPSGTPTFEDFCDVCPDDIETGVVQCLQVPDEELNLALPPNDATKQCGEWEEQGLAPRVGIVPFRCRNFLLAVQKGACGGCGTVCPATHRPSASPSRQPVITQDGIAVSSYVATSSVLLSNMTNPMNEDTVAAFERIALLFLTDHVSRAVDVEEITFTYVTVLSQAPRIIDRGVRPGQRRQLENGNINLLVLFEVGAEINSTVSTDFQWIVDTLFEININDFLSRLAKSSIYLLPSGLEGQSSPGEVSVESDTEDSSGAFFNTWIIASLGAVALSVFVSALLVARVSRRRDRRFVTDEEWDDANTRRNLSPIAEDEHESDFHGAHIFDTYNTINNSKPMYGWRTSGLEVVEEESLASKSLAGLNYVGSDSLASVSGVSGDCVSTLTNPTFRDKRPMGIDKYRSHAQHSQKEVEGGHPAFGLNARMRKRLIEREVQKNGIDAGISMEAILLATSSFSEESAERRTADHVMTIPESHPLERQRIEQTKAELQRSRQTTKQKPRISKWFGRYRDHSQPQERHEELFAERSSSRTRTMCEVPSNADVVTVVHDESPPEKLVNRGAKGRLKRKRETKKRATRKDVLDGMAEEYGGIGARPIHYSEYSPRAQSPLWKSEGPDQALGYVYVGPKSVDDSALTTPGNSAQGKMQSPWKHPGRIRTEFVPTPLATSDPVAVDPQQQYVHQQDALPSATYQQRYHYPHSSPYNVATNKSGIGEPTATSGRSELPPSGVRLIRKGSRLSKIERPAHLHSTNHCQDHDTVVEMTVGSGASTVIVGSLDDDHGGLELELGHAV